MGRAVKGNKKDFKDSNWISELVRSGVLKGILSLRRIFVCSVSLLVISRKLVSQRSSEKNCLYRWEYCYRLYRLSYVFHWLKKVCDYLFVTKDFDPRHVLSLFHGE